MNKTSYGEEKIDIPLHTYIYTDGMAELTSPLEQATRKKIDQMLNNLGWTTDEELPTCNVFTERAKTKEQNAKFKGKKPDYVLYQYETDNPIAIIEAKRKGQSIEEALKQGIERYAKPLNVKIVFVYDGAFFKSWNLKDEKELIIDGQTLTQLISEKKVLRFIQEGHSISEITPKIKHTRAELINIFKWVNNLLRDEGIREGMDRFTEFANFLFLKLISEMEEEREKNNEDRILPKQYSWDAFSGLEDKLMLNYINNTVLPYLVKQYNHSGDVFEKELAITNSKTLKEIVNRLSKVRLIDSDSDVKGDAFEYFLKTSITIGNDLGEYFTPRHLVNLMIDLTEPKFGEKIYDPTCGTGGFLIASFNYIKKRCANTKNNLKTLREDIIFGRELTSTARIAKMNMILTGDGHNNIKQLDSLKNPIKEEYDLVLANPPYGQQTHYGSYYPIPSNNGDAVFIQHIWESLKEGGRAAVVIPEGLLFRGSSENQVRKFLLKNSDIKAIISLPQGIFRPYAKGNKTNIIIFERNKGGTKSVWFYDLKADGFDLESDMRRPVEENDIPDLLSKWTDKIDSRNSWNVGIEKIEENNCDLLISTYKPKEKSEIGLVKFSEFASPKSSKIKIEENQTYKQIKVQLYGNGAVLRDNIQGKDIKTKAQSIANTGDMIVSKIDARNGALAIIPEELDNGIVSSDFPLFSIDTSKINLDYLNCCLKHGNFRKVLESHSKGTTNRRRVKPKDILNLLMYLPSMTEQEILASRIMRQENIISNADATIESLKEGMVDISDFKGDHEYMNLESVCEGIKSGGTPSRTNLGYFKGNIPWVKISDMKILDYTSSTEEKINPDAIEDSSAKLLPKGTVLVSIFATIDAVSTLSIEATTNQAIAGLIPKTNLIIPEYLMYYMHTLKPYYVSKSRGIAQKNINLEILKAVKIPVPSKTIQKQIIEEIEKRKSFLKDLENSKMIPAKIIKDIMGFVDK